MEKTLEQKMVVEAIERMKMLDIVDNAIKEFKDEQKVNISEAQKMGGNRVGVLYWANEEQIEIINKFEKKFNALVYHGILTHYEYGDMLALLYVSDGEDEWELDRDDIRNNLAYAWVENLFDPECSEIGQIQFKRAFGGLIREY